MVDHQEGARFRVKAQRHFITSPSCPFSSSYAVAERIKLVRSTPPLTPPRAEQLACGYNLGKAMRDFSRKIWVATEQAEQYFGHAEQ